MQLCLDLRYCTYIYIYTALDIPRCPDIFQREVLSDEAFWAEGLTEYLRDVFLFLALGESTGRYPPPPPEN